MDHLIVGNDDCDVLDIVDILKESQSVLNNWLPLANRLKTRPSELISLEKQINVNTITYTSLLYKLLQDWRSRESDNAKLVRLIDFLRKDGHNLAAGQLTNYFSRP